MRTGASVKVQTTAGTDARVLVKDQGRACNAAVYPINQVNTASLSSLLT